MAFLNVLGASYVRIVLAMVPPPPGHLWVADDIHGNTTPVAACRKMRKPLKMDLVAGIVVVVVVELAVINEQVQSIGCDNA